jgi:phage gp36-like protein
MAYSTEQQFLLLGLPAVALDGVTDTSSWRDAAQGQIDSYLRGRYRLPLVSPPEEIIEVECKLAAYSFLSNRGFDPEAGANQNVVLRYKDAVGWLKAMSEGKVNLAVEADQTAARAEGGPIISSRAWGRTGGSCSSNSWCNSSCRGGFWGNT